MEGGKKKERKKVWTAKVDQNGGGRGGFERNGQKAGEKIRKGGGKRKQADQEGKREGEGESNFSIGGKKTHIPPPLFCKYCHLNAVDI